MRNAQVAEWILALVTSRESAASTVGDLIENPSHRGGLWFWTVVLRTTFSLFWRGFAADPTRMMGLALRGFLLQLVMLVATVICVAILAIPIGLWLDHTGTAIVPGPPPLSAPESILGFVIVLGVIPFQIGRWLARRSPGLELAPVLAFTIIYAVVLSVIGLFAQGADSNLFEFTLGLVFSLAVALLAHIPMFAGAVWVRWKRMSAASELYNSQ